MILGIGTDLCSIERITHVRNQFPIRFEAKILTKKEQKELFYRSDKNAYIAKRFAAKEAIYKAFSFIKQNSISWQELEILNDARSGAPVVSIQGNCLEKFNAYLGKGYKGIIHISLTDEYSYAMAYVIIEKINEN